MSAVLPTLTLTGWIYDKNIIIKKLMEYFLTSDYSQSTLYYGKISSLKYLIKEYQYDKSLLIDNVKNTLENLYKRYFKEVEIEISIDDSTSEAVMYLDITCYDEDNKKYTLTQSFNINEDIMTKVDEKILRSE